METTTINLVQKLAFKLDQFEEMIQVRDFTINKDFDNASSVSINPVLDRERLFRCPGKTGQVKDGLGPVIV